MLIFIVNILTYIVIMIYYLNLAFNKTNITFFHLNIQQKAIFFSPERIVRSDANSTYRVATPASLIFLY